MYPNIYMWKAYGIGHVTCRREHWVRHHNITDISEDADDCRLCHGQQTVTLAGGGTEPGGAQAGGEGAAPADQPRHCREGALLKFITVKVLTSTTFSTFCQFPEK
jgi:hypothetical protein